MQQRLAEPVQAAAEVKNYADDGRWLWMHRRAEGHGPVCPDIACADFRKRLGLPPAPDWRTPPATPAAPRLGGTET